MKQERLFKIIGQIDETLVENAESIKISKSKKSILLKYGTLAACAILTVGIGITMFQNSKKPPIIDIPPVSSEDSKLPLLDIDIDSIHKEAMGFECYHAYHIKELINGNPWQEHSQLTHLPVIKNVNALDKRFMVENPDLEAMESLLINTANILGMNGNQLPIKKSLDEPLLFLIEDSNCKVEVDSTLTATAWFKTPIPLPKNLTFGFYSTYDQLYSVGEYFQKKYSRSIPMENPVINISGGDYSNNGKQQYHLGFFDRSGNEVQQILNYNLSSLTLSPDENGNLYMLRFQQPDLTNIIGNYPIINKEQALQLLENGNYITTVQEKFPGMKYVRKVELIYRSGAMEKIYMPYYCIYVTIPNLKETDVYDKGMNAYGTYYIPAIYSQFIKNVPIWDGHFN